jgi:hypothetical protein
MRQTHQPTADAALTRPHLEHPNRDDMTGAAACAAGSCGAVSL